MKTSLTRSRRWLCAVLLLGAVWRAEGADKRPNILFVFGDDWGRHAGAYAALEPGGPNDLLRTPHFDRIAREGVLFRNAFVSSPSCTPSRSAVMSGQHFWRTGRGAILRGAVWDFAIPSYALMLREHGYHIGHTYKVWDPGTPEDGPYGSRRFAYEQGGVAFNQFSNNATAMIAAGRSVGEAKATLYREVRDNFDAFLAARPEGQPFCYWFGTKNTHRNWTRGSGKKLWGLEPDDLRGKLPPFLPDVPEVREDLADYLGEVQALDAGLGVLLARLEEIGELDDTLIVLSGDNGAPGFPHGKCTLYDFGCATPLAIRGPGVTGGRVVDDFVSLTDLAPTFLETGGVATPSVMTGRSLVALLRASASGQIEPARDAAYFGRERHVESARADFSPYPQRAIRTRDFLYIVNFRPERWPMGEPYRLDGDNPPAFAELAAVSRTTLYDEDAGPTKAWLVLNRDDPQGKPFFERAYGKRPREELYDLRTDPHQMKNVAADPRYAGAREELENRLLAELTRTADPRMIDDGAYFETPPLAGPLKN